MRNICASGSSLPSISVEKNVVNRINHAANFRAYGRGRIGYKIIENVNPIKIIVVAITQLI